MSMEIAASTLLTFNVDVPIDPAAPCNVAMEPIEVTFPVIIVWRLPTGYQFSSAGVFGLAGPDFHDGRFDGISRKRFRWTARAPGSKTPLNYSLAIEWVNAQGVLQSCVVPNLRIINRS